MNIQEKNTQICTQKEEKYTFKTDWKMTVERIDQIMTPAWHVLKINIFQSTLTTASWKERTYENKAWRLKKLALAEEVKTIISPLKRMKIHGVRLQCLPVSLQLSFIGMCRLRTMKYSNSAHFYWHPFHFLYCDCTNTRAPYWVSSSKHQNIELYFWHLPEIFLDYF